MIAETVVHVDDRRMTYESVEKILDEDPEETGRYENICVYALQ